MEIITAFFCVLSLGLLANCDIDIADNSGKEFIIGFMDNVNIKNLTLFLTTNNPATVQVRISAHPNLLNLLPLQSRTTNVRRGSVTKVDIPISFAMKTSYKQFKGLFLSSDDEFIVYGSNAMSSSLDAFLALPVDTLGQEYITGSYKACLGSYPALVGLIGTHNSTNIEITPPPGKSIIAMGSTVSSKTQIILNRLETIQIQSNSDITGTRINSSKPLAVMSGNKCTQVPCGVSACDHLVEQMYPIDRWGYTFTVVPSAYRQSGDIIRVVGSTDDTVVDITGVPRLVLHKSKFYEFKVLKKAPVFVNSSRPIMVLQFTQSQGTDNLPSDPYMMIVPAIEQFSSSYTIATANLPDKVYKNFVNIVIRKSSTEDLRVDGAALIGVTWLAIPGTDFTAAQLNVTAGTHRIEHISPIQTFSVFSYGFASYVSYGYPGGLRLASLDVTKCLPNTGQPADGVDNDCDMKIDEELFNGIDDDDDGVIDEDLSSLPPVVDFPKDTVIVSGNATLTHSLKVEAGTPNATGSERCVAYRDITINFTDSSNDNGCGMDIERTWFVQDGCGNIVQATQNVSVYSSWKAFRADPSFNCTGVLQRVGCNESTEVSEIGQCTNTPCKGSGSHFALVDGYKCSCVLPGGGAKCIKDKCASDLCHSGGVCIKNETTYQCICPIGFHGKHCDQIDWCAGDPCHNGGVCIYNETAYQCICPPGFYGRHCDQKNWCAGNPCLNGSVCINNDTTYQCICPPGLRGRHCDQINWCVGDPCLNGGVCINNETTYQCICPTGFHGENCTEINWCAGNPCHNGGVCINNETTYQCICLPGFQGKHCDQMNWCAGDPCLNGSVCINNETTYHCICPPGFHGMNCDQIDWCVDDPCLNGGVCINNETTYQCICPTGFHGKDCDQINWCAGDPCHNGAVCIKNETTYQCICPTGFHGRLCDQIIENSTTAESNALAAAQKTSPGSITVVVPSVTAAGVVLVCVVCIAAAVWKRQQKKRKTKPAPNDDPVDQEEQVDEEDDDEETQCSSPSKAVIADPPATALFPDTSSGSGSERLHTGSIENSKGDLDQDEQADVEGDDEGTPCSPPSEAVIADPPATAQFRVTSSGSGSERLHTGNSENSHGDLKVIDPGQSEQSHGYTASGEEAHLVGSLKQALPRRLPPLHT